MMLIARGARLLEHRKKKLVSPVLEVATRCSYQTNSVYPADFDCVIIASDIKSQATV